MGDEGTQREHRSGHRGRGMICGRKYRRERPRFYKGGTEEDPLNLNNVGIDPEQELKEMEKEANQIQGFMPKNPRDPLGIEKLEKANKRRQALLEGPSPHKKQKNAQQSTSSADQKAEVSGETPEEEAARKKREKKERHNRNNRYGNFNQYYGTRLTPGEKDPRLDLLPKEWFYKKNVLDIGCNVGYLTLSIARDYSPRRILGIDIDEHLIGVARKNIRHYCDSATDFVGKFPASFSQTFGPISQHSLTFTTKFPDNVWFRQQNYVLEEDHLLEMVEPEYNVILALSITKWIHLNFGDAGLKRFFLRAFNHLLPGGIFVLEPQSLESYKKRAKMLPELWANYAAIQFKPDDFKDFLVYTVGFERVEDLGACQSKTKGFCRPVEVYYKAGSSKKKPDEKEKTDSLASIPEKPVVSSSESENKTSPSADPQNA